MDFGIYLTQENLPYVNNSQNPFFFVYPIAISISSEYNPIYKQS